MRAPLLLLPTLLVACANPGVEPGRQQRALGSDASDLPLGKDSGGDASTLACGSIDHVGCCDGETLWWCAGGILKSLRCGERPSCGWNAAAKYHDCNTSGGSDPAGGFAKECFLVTDAALPRSDGPTRDGGGDCRGVKAEGCCDGNTLLYCVDGVLRVLHCGLNPACGWLANAQFYDCGTEGLSDPKGVYKKACPIQAPDGLAIGLRDLSSGEPSVDLGTVAGDTAPVDGCECTVGRGEPATVIFWLLLAAIGFAVRRQVR